MNYRPDKHANTLEDRYGLRVTARLQDDSDALPYDIAERLRAARMQALAHRKVVQARTAMAVSVSSGGATMTMGDEGLNLWSRLAGALPLMALVAGLITIVIVQDDDRALEMAEVDAALLTDDLPPAAYTDPGFLQYLKSAPTLTQQ